MNLVRITHGAFCGDDSFNYDVPFNMVPSGILGIIGDLLRNEHWFAENLTLLRRIQRPRLRDLRRGFLW